MTDAVAQSRQTEKLVVVAIDGFRWQELFGGIDSRIAAAADPVDSLFYNSRQDRAELMPFMWTEVASRGQLYGNRNIGNRVNCRNHRLISYPGYSEMLVGFPSLRIFSNKKVANPYATVFEKMQQDAYAKVAVFSTWSTFPFIFREEQSGIPVNPMKANNVGQRSDSLTFRHAMDYLEAVRPDVLMIAFDGTDHWAHRGNYPEYLKAAHRADNMLADLWTWVQQQPDYRDKTTLFVTTDHGRGTRPSTWQKHRLMTRGSRHVWFAVMGPDTPPKGEVRTSSRLFLSQAAATFAAFLDYPYENVRQVDEFVSTMFDESRYLEARGARK